MIFQKVICMSLVHISAIYSSQDLKTNQVAKIKCEDKETKIAIHNELLLSSKKE